MAAEQLWYPGMDDELTVRGDLETNLAIVLQNPYSQNAGEVDGRVSQLAEDQSAHKFSIERQPTVPDDDDMVSLLEDLLLGNPTAVLGIAGGDGTVNKVLNAYYKLWLAYPQLTNPIMILGGGNIDDMAHMSHNQHALEDLTDILLAGVIRQMRPLLVNVNGETTLAGAYTGYGITGKTARGVNRSREHRLRNLPSGGRLLDGALAARELIGRKAIDIEIDNELTSTIDYSVFNGGRMAQFFHPQADFFGPEATVTHFEKQGLMPLLGRMTLLAAGKLKGQPLAGGRELWIEQDTVGHVDGEDFDVPEGSHVTIQHMPHLKGRPAPFTFQIITSKKPKAAALSSRR